MLRERTETTYVVDIDRNHSVTGRHNQFTGSSISIHNISNASAWTSNVNAITFDLAMTDDIIKALTEVRDAMNKEAS